MYSIGRIFIFTHNFNSIIQIFFQMDLTLYPSVVNIYKCFDKTSVVDGHRQLFLFLNFKN
ncbi:MAG: hypothetical protein EA412_07075 [Chitinophagaceae bacterium]|nr:MAG: hypothetical protein EA412_07075 [Chitinophagaceae bacterium]